MTKQYQVTNPLQGLIAKAANTLPQHTGNVQRAQERIERISNRPTVVLADVSGSMASTAWGGRSKHSLLRDAVAATLQPGQHELMAFSDGVQLLARPAMLPEPVGGTALHLALKAALERNPGRILVISDGEPDNEAEALAVAARFAGVIDVLYIGSDANVAAMRFLQALARAGYGRYQSNDIAQPGRPALTNTIQLLLGGART